MALVLKSPCALMICQGTWVLLFCHLQSTDYYQALSPCLKPNLFGPALSLADSFTLVLLSWVMLPACPAFCGHSCLCGSSGPHLHLSSFCHHKVQVVQAPRSQDPQGKMIPNNNSPFFFYPETSGLLELTV